MMMKMAAQHRNRGGQAAAPPSFSLLSLNVARQATLGGLAVLLDQLPQLPTFNFLQEVALSADLLQAAAQRLGLKHMSLHSPLIYLAALSYSTALLRFQPSRTSPQALHSLSLSRRSPSSMSIVHAPSGAHNAADRDNFFRNDVAEAIAALPAPPLLIGDFNCVLMPANTAGTFRNKRCPPLADLVAAYDLTDGFYSLHPNVPSFTFFRRNTPGSRLDRAYIPPQLLPHLLAVTHPRPCRTIQPSMFDWQASYRPLSHHPSPPPTGSSTPLW